MTNFWIASPTRSTSCDRIFSWPQMSFDSSSLRMLRIDHDGDDDFRLAGSKRCAREEAGGLVDLEPGRSLCQGKPGLLDVEVTAYLVAALHPCRSGPPTNGWPCTWYLYSLPTFAVAGGFV